MCSIQLWLISTKVCVLCMTVISVHDELQLSDFCYTSCAFMMMALEPTVAACVQPQVQKFWHVLQFSKSDSDKKVSTRRQVAEVHPVIPDVIGAQPPPLGDLDGNPINRLGAEEQTGHHTTGSVPISVLSLYLSPIDLCF